MITIRGADPSQVNNTRIQSVYINSNVGTVIFSDVTFTATPPTTTSNADTAIITSKTSDNAWTFNNLVLRSCRFVAGAANPGASIRSSVVWVPVVRNSLNITDSYCADVRYLLGLTYTYSRSDYLWDNVLKNVLIANTAFPATGCVVSASSATRLSRDYVQMIGNYFHNDQPTTNNLDWNAACHSFQGYKRVELLNNRFVRTVSSALNWQSQTCLHIRGSRYVLTNNTMSSVSWIRIFSDAAATIANNSFAPITVEGVLGDFPTIAPDTDVVYSNLNLRLNWWGYPDGPRITQYNGTKRESYFPWYASADMATAAIDCSSCAFSCDYATGKCIPVPLDSLTVAGIASTTGIAAFFILLVFAFPYLRFFCCRPAEFR